jgi:hypothetical protein
MALFSRGPELPAEVGSRVPGRALAATRSEDGTWLVGTRDALVVLDADAVHEVPWERVQRADWDQDTDTLRVEEIEDYGHPVNAAAYVIREPGALLVLLRERVTASILVQRRVNVHKKRGFTVIGRRPPTGRGTTTWAFEFDAGVDPDDPIVRTLAEAALRDAQESVGL